MTARYDKQGWLIDYDEDKISNNKLRIILRMQDQKLIKEQLATERSICPKCHMSRSTYEIQHGICYSCD